ncbi:hypothetical protein OIA45_39645 [Streptomyces chartreusis]|nr:hypothetical protein OIA45_39645 [Streptomyces chartreusis]
MIRAWAALAAAAVAAVLLVAACDGPPADAVPRPHPNPAPVAPTTGR